MTEEFTWKMWERGFKQSIHQYFISRRYSIHGNSFALSRSLPCPFFLLFNFLFELQLQIIESAIFFMKHIITFVVASSLLIFSLYTYVSVNLIPAFLMPHSLLIYSYFTLFNAYSPEDSLQTSSSPSSLLGLCLSVHISGSHYRFGLASLLNCVS